MARSTLKGHDVGSLGPSDSSDTGADMMGLGRTDDTSDRNATGERMTVGLEPELPEIDLNIDRIVSPEEAGLGDDLDDAEEARLHITDEEIEEHFRRRQE